MTQTLSLDRAIDAPPSLPPVARAAVGDDTAMLRAAVDAGRDLIAPDARIYWFDLTASVIVGYGALALAIALSGGGALLAGVVAILALYRAGSFIHELTHFKRAHLPGFWLGWNALVGVPLLVPSFLYEGVHTLHHARTRYGTVDDPEYLPLASMKPWSLPMFVVAALFAPIALLLRFAVVAPLSALSPALRGAVVARFSALAINPAFRRRAPEGEAAREWVALEAAASVWAIALLTLVATGIVPLRAFAIFLAVAAGVALLNQVAHAGRASVGQSRRAGDDGDGAIPRYRQRAPTGVAAVPVGAGRPALPCAAPSDPQPSLSCAGDRAPPAECSALTRLGLSPRELSRSAGPGRSADREHDGSWREARRYSSVLTSTASPTARNRKNGPQAASSGG